jgi:ABC-type multidrug transport system fused ATPase/permease subunit
VTHQTDRVLAQVELDFNCVERIGEYLDVTQEAPAIIEASRPPAYWPSSTSGIVVHDLWVRYSPTSPDVLKGLTFLIRSGEKVGVVGRTGSGKTTLCAALLRLIEPTQGQIM